MASLADLPEVVGFFSYSREDDEDSHGHLSALRSLIQGELRGQLGRTAKTFRLWQDKEAIPSGTLWESEIKNAVGQSVFFIPVITPTVVRSPYCKFELESFVGREVTLGRADLVFPILYIDVPELEDHARRQNDRVLSLIARRQYRDWRDFRYLDVHSAELRREVGRFCTDIRNALRRPWISPEEREREQEAAALRQAQAERQHQQAEAKRRAEEEARLRAEEESRQRAAEAEPTGLAALEAKAREDEKRRQREAEAEQRKPEAEPRRAEEGRLRKEPEAKRRAEAEERRRLRRSEGHLFWPPSGPALAGVCFFGVVLLGAIGAWFALWPTPAPVAPAPPPPVTPAPTPTEPAQQAANTLLSAEQERSLKPKDTFQECSKCPVMTVVPAGSFTMGSPDNEPGRDSTEGPQHTVTISQQFGVSKFEVTFAEWDACVAEGGCNGYKPGDRGWGRARRPVINVNWDDANAYVSWLAKKTGKPYRLLSEAEYEYGTRAGTTTVYPWGAGIKLNGQAMANCGGCGSVWDGKETAPVGSFPPNAFGLYDMVGNVAEWTEDCGHDNYNGAPNDGSAWTSGNCTVRVYRGGFLYGPPSVVRSAFRYWYSTDMRSFLMLTFGGNAYQTLGFRVARTLLGR
jgi:formylglycine-generating enzyme required for sulfatase activity